MQEKSRFLPRPDGTVYDSKTTLTWKANDSRLDMDKDVSWLEAGEYALETNKKKTGGHADWRLPTINEAMTIFDKTAANKDFKGGDIHIDPVFPPGAGNCTWTSTTRGEREAQILFFVNGFPYWYNKDDKTISHAVRLVRR